MKKRQSVVDAKAPIASGESLTYARLDTCVNHAIHFSDEVPMVNPICSRQLLRVLSRMEFCRMGCPQSPQLDVREWAKLEELS
jgi:hypothetical protein